MNSTSINTWELKIINKNCFLTPEDIEQISDEINKIRCRTNIVLSKKQIKKTLIKVKKIEILSLLERIEELAINIIWEDERAMWYYENILSFGEQLKQKYWEDCQFCLYWQILSWDPNPRKDVFLTDFEWDDAILKHLISIQKYLLNK